MGKDAPVRDMDVYWRETANALGYPVGVLNQSGTIVAVNTAWKRSPFGRRDDSDPVGSDYIKLCAALPGRGFPPAELVASGVKAVLEGTKKRFESEYSGYSKQRASRFRVTISPLSRRRGAMVTHTYLGDSPSRVAPLEPTLSDNLLNETPDGVFLCNRSGRLLIASAMLERWFDVRSDQIVGQSAASIEPPELSKLILEGHQTVIANGKTHTFEHVAMTAHGLRTFSVTKGLHYSSTGKVKGVFGIARDISNIRAMEREIIEISDKEKQRLGQDLHENLCQYLVGISLLGNVLYEDLLRLQLKQAEDARQVTGLVKHSISEVRALVKGLSPMPVEQEEGLLAAFHELSEQARVIGKVECVLRFPETSDFLDPSTAMHLFRIAQEAVHNAIKHAHAKLIRITVRNSRKSVMLTVEDNGIGFSLGETVRSEGGFGLGLHIMGYRSRAMGAEFDIRRNKPKGTLVICTLLKKKPETLSIRSKG